MQLSKLILILQLLFVFSASAQNNYEELSNEPCPISISSVYSSAIDLLSLKVNFSTPLFDNDSLYKAYNNDRVTFSASYISGFGKSFENGIWFKESSTHIVLDTGHVWIYKINTVSGLGVNIALDSLQLPLGAQLSYFYFDYEGGVNYDVYDSSIDLESFNIVNQRSKTLYVEYFEPCNIVGQYDFKILSWCYVFANHEKDLNVIPLKTDSTPLARICNPCYFKYQFCNVLMRMEKVSTQFTVVTAGAVLRTVSTIWQVNAPLARICNPCYFKYQVYNVLML
ncbi:hypothetical protein LX69_02633 [Breznakibacter xylanolyticus]|uniref:Uncharacterized protein n=1 Tax=Breznakibacter xylanolyticus TaxID=990 RepID=A0A2W7NQE9_9BACT|nr:hypothetical protein [Breznakibacter xylanolyticus]PZX13522.1 hypothetical protein LX69_02633 [Breznakibacter xylanolyticus]